jgi:type VI secretion system protein ImpB
VEIGGAIEMKELPFVVGVLADLTGKPAEPLPRLKDRKFVEIDRDNFDKVLKGLKPRLTFDVENTLQNDGTRLKVELNFESMEDFEPEQVARKVPALKELLDARSRLSDLNSKLDGNDKLETILQDVIKNTDKMTALRTETGRGAPQAEAEPEPQTEESA